MARLFVPQLPLAHDEVHAASEEAINQLLPELLGMLTDALGMKMPRVPGRTRVAIKKRFRQALQSARGYMLGMQLLDGELTPELARYAFHEGQLHQFLMLGDKPEDGEHDAWLILLRRLEKQAARPELGSSFPGYAEARDAVDALASEVATALETQDIEPVLNGWHQLNEARRVAHHLQRWAPLVRSWRWQEPKRLTAKLVTQLMNEYRDSAATFELLIKRMVGIQLAVQGQAVDWRALYGQTLAWHLQRALSNTLGPHLAVLAQGIHRGVRNALAHGHPLVNPRTRKVEFHDRNGQVVEWTAEELHRNTRRLSAFVLAISSFDSELQLVRFRKALEYAAGAALRAGATPREVDTTTRGRASLRKRPTTRRQASRRPRPRSPMTR